MTAATTPVTPARDRVRLSDAAPPRVRARYDSAQTTDENIRHWANADALSALAAHSPEVRRTLRIRARYEIANSPLARGILRRLADYVVGTGPRLQIKGPAREFNRAVQQRWTEWTIATGYVRKLWLLVYDELQNGEAFAVEHSNLGLRYPHGGTPYPVKLDVRLVEADQIANPHGELTDPSDGIVFDDFGNPIAYRVLDRHPGDFHGHVPGMGGFSTVPAGAVRHLFRADRPGQVRGVPAVTPALGLFALRRRYLLAVVHTAEHQASISGYIKTQSSPDPAEDIEPYDSVDFHRDEMHVLPKGWEAQWPNATQPQSTLEMFDRVLIREVGRALDMPYGLAANDSSDYNFASAKIDLSPFHKRVGIDQDRVEDVAVEPTFRSWWDESRRVPGYLPDEARGMPAPEHNWMWDGQDFLDPREAQAKATSLAHGIETLPMIYARQGKDVEVELESGAAALGMSLDDYRRLIVQTTFGDAPAAPQEDADDE